MNPLIPHHEIPATRRDFLRRSGAGFGAIALASMLSDKRLLASLGDQDGVAGNPALNHLPHTPGRARNVIFLFMEGGPSHIDLFDPKPKLNELHGQKLPDSFEMPVLAMGEANAPLMGSERTFKQHGQSGLWMSDWLPHTAEMADDLAVIRSCVSDGINHSGGMSQMNTGSIFGGRPSLGSWVSYGMGSENNNMPSFVVLTDSERQVVNGVRNWGSGFMPAAYQGVQLQSDGPPITNLNNPDGVSNHRQHSKLSFLEQLNRRHLLSREDVTELDARIKSYEMAFRMQAEAPDAVDLSRETAETKALYGMDESETETYGRMCLLSRRLVERGVRFVQLYHGAGSRWDSHSNLEREHANLCRGMDKPVAGLLKDLKRRGLLDETLVVWGGEFGRTPMSEKGNGRDHNPTGFTMWMAGGGIPGGQVIGSTDELGLYAVEDRLHVHDLHATMMHVLGVDHTRLIYHNKGRPERVDVNEGHAYQRILG